MYYGAFIFVIANNAILATFSLVLCIYHSNATKLAINFSTYELRTQTKLNTRKNRVYSHKMIGCATVVSVAILTFVF